jgi:hypothetical protein
MATKRVAIIDIDRCCSFPKSRLGISLILADWINAKNYDAIYFCTHRRLRLHGFFINNIMTQLAHIGEVELNKLIHNLLTCNIIPNFLGVADLTEKLVAVSTPDDKTVGLGQGYLQRLKPYEDACAASHAKTGKYVFPETSQMQIVPEKDDKLCGEFNDEDENQKAFKNEQLQQIFDDAGKIFSSSDYVIYDYVDDNDECLEGAKRISAPKNSELNIHRHLSTEQDKGVELLHTVKGELITSTTSIVMAMGISLSQLSLDEDKQYCESPTFQYDPSELQTVDLGSNSVIAAEPPNSTPGSQIQSPTVN